MGDIQPTPAGELPTYSVTTNNSVAANTATDFFTVTGSATRTIRITNIIISGIQTLSGTVTLIFLKRSTANTGGTSTTPAPIAFDSANPAATAVARVYTANPTLGTLIGNLYDCKRLLSNGAVAQDVIDKTYGDNETQEIVLRGTGEVFAINLNGATINGNNFDITVKWTEE